MKIAIVTSTFPPYAGGIGNVAAANARSLAKLGHQVTVFTPKYGLGEESVTDINIKRMPVFLAYGNAAWCPSLSKRLKGFDIIHLHYPYFGGAEVIWRHHRKYQKSGAKILVHYHMDVVGSGLLKFIFSVHKKIMLPRIIKMANKVIVTSQDYAESSFLKDDIKNNPEKFVEVPNGVYSHKFIKQEKDQALLQKHDIKPDEKVVLFVGGLDKAHYFKGVNYLLEAMSRLRQKDYNWKLIIVGKGELKKDYSSLAYQLKIDSKVIFADSVSGDDLVKYYNLADVAVLPSVDRSEAFGLVLVEAMSCGKPVIASDLAGVRSVVEDKISGLLVELKNSDDLATKINYILSHNQVATLLGNSGRKRVEDKYDWEVIGKQINQIYQELIKSNDKA